MMEDQVTVVIHTAVGGAIVTAKVETEADIEVVIVVIEVLVALQVEAETVIRTGIDKDMEKKVVI